MAAEPNPTPSGREILAALIDEALSNGDIIPSVEAARILNIMQTQFPREWAAFCEQECAKLVGQEVRSANSSRRQRARKHHAAALYGEAVATGDVKRLGVFRLWRCRVDVENTQRALGQMTKDDHEFVANTYSAQAHQQRMLESFHRVIGRKVPPGMTTEDVLSEKTVMEIYDQIVADEAP